MQVNARRRRQAEYDRALRSGDREVPEPGDLGGGGIVYNMDVTPDGNPVTANSLTNQVGLIEIK
jgi:hypothetical protein